MFHVSYVIQRENVNSAWQFWFKQRKVFSFCFS